tara:strand:+ start:1927 stop:2418 length:492 start_codon:yes stop_codon:yes gene_type:complete
MSLIIEDGSIVAGANSYITGAAYIAWADARFGAARTTAPADVAAAEVIILRSMRYFEAQIFQGLMVEEDQPLQFPRDGVWIDSWNIKNNEIPREVISSMYELVYADETGNGMLSVVDRETKSERVGDLEIEYMDNSSSRSVVPAVSAYMKKLLARSMGSVVRI